MKTLTQISRAALTAVVLAAAGNAMAANASISLNTSSLAALGTVTLSGLGSDTFASTGTGTGTLTAPISSTTLSLADFAAPDGFLVTATTKVFLSTIVNTMAFTDFTEARMPFPPDLRPRLLALGDRVVLGSDFPNTPYVYAHQLEALVRLELGDDWLRGVLSDNGARLLGLPAR